MLITSKQFCFAVDCFIDTKVSLSRQNGPMLCLEWSDTNMSDPTAVFLVMLATAIRVVLVSALDSAIYSRVGISVSNALLLCAQPLINVNNQADCSVW